MSRVPPAGRPEVDPQALRAAARGWDNRLQAAMLGAAMLGAALYPVVLDGVLARFGVMVVGTALAVLAILGTASAAVASRRDGRPGALVARGGVALLALWNLAGSSLLPLLLLPAWIYATLAWAFFSSLRGESSLVERTIRQLQPVAPGFIGPYCRTVTFGWGLVLAGNAATLTALALTASVQTWKAAAGYGLWTWMAAVSLVEFLVRKTYFRNYYYRGPFERLWEKLFPAEDTEMGRRSAAYIREVREQLERARREGNPRDAA